MNEALAKWQNLIAGVLIVLVLAYGANNYLYKPKIKQINSIKSSLKLIDSEIRMIQGGELLLKNLDMARTMLRNELDQLSSKIPSETDTPYLINNFMSIVGRGLNIDYNLIQPFAIAPEAQYKRLPLRVDFEANFANLNSYLGQLKKLPVTIRVDNMDLHKVQGQNKLAVKLSLSAFVMPGGKEKPSGKITDYGYLYDPFYFIQKNRPKEMNIESAGGLRYSGYWIGKEIKAIINDDVYKAGDTVNGFTVLKIYKDRVILSKNKKLFELTIGGR